MRREGFVALDRNIRRSAMWPRGRPFTPLEAWLDLLLSARWREGVVEYQGIDHTLDRGELVTSIRQLSRAWSWDRKRVRRQLRAWVKNGALVAQNRDRHGIHIFVTNYETYNPAGTKVGTIKGPLGGPKRDHERTKTTREQVSTTTTDARVVGRWACEQCGDHPAFRSFNEYVEHIEAQHPEVLEDG